jgi:hypothetical protein
MTAMTSRLQLSLTDFVGNWSLRREIDDHLAGAQSCFVGTAVFSNSDGGVLLAEDGVLTMAGQRPMQATRRYLWRQNGDAIAVSFDDGRDFHTFRPNEDAPLANHGCPPDFYRVTYDFSDWPNWRSTWQVTGPRKDYRLTSGYRR